MRPQRYGPRYRVPRFAPVGTVACTALLVGCQSYSPQPLELNDFRAEVESRSVTSEAVAGFAARLAESELGVPTRFDASDGISSAEAEVLALFYNAELRLARLDAASALSSLEYSGLWEDPVFGFDGAEILSPEGPFEFGLILEWTIPLSGRLGVEKDRASARYETELKRVIEAEWSVRMRVRAAWAQWSDALLRAELLREFVSDSERVVDLTDRLEEAGELTRVEARLIRGQLASARLELAGAGLAVEEASSRLFELMGLWPNEQVSLIPSLSPAGMSEENDPIQRVITSNPTLAVRRAEYQIAEESLRLEIRKQYPDLTIGAGYGNEDDDRLLLGLSLPIPMLNGNRGGIAEARALRDRSRAEAETTFDKLARRLDLALEKQRLMRRQREAFESELVPLLDEQLEEVERLMDLGQVDSLLLLESLTRRFEAKSKLLELRLDEVRASIEVEALLGPQEPNEPTPVADTSPDNQSIDSQPESGVHPAGQEARNQ